MSNSTLNQVADRSTFRSPASTAQVAASVLSADFGALAQDASAAVAAGADMLHIDVMDGHFVPNLSMGPVVCGAMRQHLPDVMQDVHLMIDNPGERIESFAKAGADHLTVHIEVLEDAPAMAHAIRELGCTAGIALNPGTDVACVLDVAEAFDMTLVMSVVPGFSGQAFMSEVLEKTRRLRDRLGPHAHIQMDGGVSPVTAPACRDAGCNVLVSASALFGSDDYTAAVAALRGPA
ncbi:MAG: ribulose-phosphate 3-epimerase [Phycisphaerales bacterium]|nr:ribulose-phosphate 3-epimerase [Phycisphaerales bacterium]